MTGGSRALANVRVVISAEATPYMAWQAKLAHYSCLSRLGQVALVVVHERDQQELEDLADITRTGGNVLYAPTYRTTSHGFDYAARNTAGTLLEVANLPGPADGSLVLCDADVVFTRRPRFGRTLSGAQCGYLDYTEGPVRDAMRRLGIAAEDIAPFGDSLECAIPYVIPRAHAKQLARAWLDAIDAFVPPRWEDVMYAFGLAAVMLGLRLRRTRLVDTNYDDDAPVRAPVVHYCYDNRIWTKRRFFSASAARRVWTPPAGAKPGTVLAEVFLQLHQARRFFAPLRDEATRHLLKSTAGCHALRNSRHTF